MKAIASDVAYYEWITDTYRAGQCIETDITNENMTNTLLCVEDITRCPKAFTGDDWHGADYCCMIAHVPYGHYTRPDEFYED